MMMRLSVSNLAWPSALDSEAFARLAALGVDGLEVAPTRLADWDQLTPAKLAEYHRKVADAGLVVSSLQAIMFGRPELQLFGGAEIFAAFCDHMRLVAEIAGTLGAKVMVFGAPRNRLRGDISQQDAWAIATERLAVLGEIVATAGTVLGIEPVPAFYGGDFLTHWEQVNDLVREVASPGLGVHLDTACVLLGEGSIGAAIKTAGDRLTHFHVAQPGLADFSQPTENHGEASMLLREVNYEKWIAIEMREQPIAPLEALKFSVRYVQDKYIQIN